MAVKPLTMEEYHEMKAWLKAGKHLPSFMRDFHDQKDLFKTVGGYDRDDPYPDISWIDGHTYTIDRFLWWMAAHGYTLQKCRAKKAAKTRAIKKEERERQQYLKLHAKYKT